MQVLADELQDEFLPALIWLTAGAVAEYGNGNVGSLDCGEEFDHADADGPKSSIDDSPGHRWPRRAGVCLILGEGEKWEN